MEKIPWCQTNNIQKARATLNRMIDFLPSNSELKTYVVSDCKHLLSLSDSTDLLDNNGLPSISFNFNLTKSNNLKQLSNFVNRPGVYLFTHLPTNNLYIGSAVCLKNRFKSHLMNSFKPHRGGNNLFYLFVRENGGWSSFNWGLIKQTSNHLLEFKKLYPNYFLDINSLEILTAFTQFEVRIYEQALLNYYRPNLNKESIVIFNFVNWQPGMKITYNRSSIIEVFSEDNQLINKYSSLTLAIQSLGLSKTTINRYLNSKFLVDSPILDLPIYLKDPNKPIKEGPIDFNTVKDLPIISDVDLFSLPKDRLVALCEDKVTVFKEFESIPSAAWELDNKSDSKYISRYINKERLVKAGGVSLYFIMHPDLLANPSL
jgi:hypothetical protein